MVLANDKDDIEYRTGKLKEKYQKLCIEINIGQTKNLCVGGIPGKLILANKKEFAKCYENKYLITIFDYTKSNEKDIKSKEAQAKYISDI